MLVDILLEFSPPGAKSDHFATTFAFAVSALLFSSLLHQRITYISYNTMQHNTQPTFNVENVQPLHQSQQSGTQGKGMMAPGHSEMGGKALLAKKMAASGSVY